MKKRRKNPGDAFYTTQLHPGYYAVHMHVGVFKGKQLPAAFHTVKEATIAGCRAVISSYLHKSGAIETQYYAAIDTLDTYGTRY